MIFISLPDCGRVATVANGSVDFSNALTTYGQSVPVSCNIGFRRIGGTSIECLADGTWSKTVNCELVGRQSCTSYLSRYRIQMLTICFKRS